MKNVILALTILGSWNTFAQQRPSHDLGTELMARLQIANEKRARALGHYEALENLKTQVIANLGVRIVDDQSTTNLVDGLSQLNVLFRADNNDICSGTASKFGPGFDRTISVSVDCYDTEGNKTKTAYWNDRKK